LRDGAQPKEGQEEKLQDPGHRLGFLFWRNGEFGCGSLLFRPFHNRDHDGIRKHTQVRARLAGLLHGESQTITVKRPVVSFLS